MMPNGSMTMRDAFIGTLCDRMAQDDSIFFLSADVGAPALDRMRQEHPHRFINVGVAEQNMINIATGLALEGFAVYTYFIAPFIMRAYEQVRVNLAVSSQVRPLNISMLALGGGLSYQVSGPTHHCLEDLAIMRLLPMLQVYSPSDWVIARQLVEYTRTIPGPKYVRFDGKSLPALHKETGVEMGKGFAVLHEGSDVCLVGTGFMTHIACRIARSIPGISVIDMFALKPYDDAALAATLAPFRHAVTLEEGFVDNGGLDSLVGSVIRNHGLACRQHVFGIRDRYVFELGSREYLHSLNGMDEPAITAFVEHLRQKE